MLRKLQAVLALLCMTSYAWAQTSVVGTASVHGNMRVDGYTVQGDATVFNGSVVETGDASANLRIGREVDLTMSKSSRGKVYSNRFVLQDGESELAGPKTYELEAAGLHVAADSPNSVGLVALTPDHAVQVAAIAGSFEVRNSQGYLLSNILPGQPRTFAMQAQASTSPFSISGVGLLDYQNGHYYLTTDENVRYELTGQNLQQFVGDKVVVSGILNPAAQSGGTAGTIAVKTIEINPGGPSSRMTKSGKWVVTATALGGAGAIGYVIYDAIQTPASR
jgi:hypothetical protein